RSRPAGRGGWPGHAHSGRFYQRDGPLRDRDPQHQGKPQAPDGGAGAPPLPRRYNGWTRRHGLSVRELDPSLSQREVLCPWRPNPSATPSTKASPTPPPSSTPAAAGARAAAGAWAPGAAASKVPTSRTPPTSPTPASPPSPSSAAATRRATAI